jgi:hypothetical protein
MSLKGMYAYAQQVAQGHFHGTIEERHGKLEFKGTVATETEKNDIWNAIKTIPTWREDINADIRDRRAKLGGADSAAAHCAAQKHVIGNGSRSRSEDLHGQVGRHAQQDRQRTSRQRKRLHEDFRLEQGPVDGPEQDQAGAGTASAVAAQRCEGV